MTTEALVEEISSLEPSERDRLLMLLMAKEGERSAMDSVDADQVLAKAATNERWFTMDELENGWKAKDGK